MSERRDDARRRSPSTAAARRVGDVGAAARHEQPADRAGVAPLVALEVLGEEVEVSDVLSRSGSHVARVVADGHAHELVGLRRAARDRRDARLARPPRGTLPPSRRIGRIRSHAGRRRSTPTTRRSSAASFTPTRTPPTIDRCPVRGSAAPRPGTARRRCICTRCANTLPLRTFSTAASSARSSCLIGDPVGRPHELVRGREHGEQLRLDPVLRSRPSAWRSTGPMCSRSVVVSAPTARRQAVRGRRVPARPGAASGRSRPARAQLGIAREQLDGAGHPAPTRSCSRGAAHCFCR